MTIRCGVHHAFAAAMSNEIVAVSGRLVVGARSRAQSGLSQSDRNAPTGR